MTTTTDQPTEAAADEVRHMPPEVAAMLIFIGILGIPLPGPGVPFILAGGLALWPRTFQPIDAQFRRKYPKAHDKIAGLLDRFEKDLNSRYPAES